MGTSVIRQTKAHGIRRFLGTGLQPLTIERRKSPRYCPHSLDCMGEENACTGYKICVVYQAREQEKERYLQEIGRVSDPLSDTVIMSAEDIAGSHRSKGHHRKVRHSTTDDSLHDRVAEGEAPEKFYSFKESLRLEPDDDRADLVFGD